MAILRGIDPETTLSSEVQGPSFRSGQTILLRAVAREEQGTLSLLGTREPACSLVQGERPSTIDPSFPAKERSSPRTGKEQGDAFSRGCQRGARQTKR